MVVRIGLWSVTDDEMPGMSDNKSYHENTGSRTDPKCDVDTGHENVYRLYCGCLGVPIAVGG